MLIAWAWVMKWIFNLDPHIPLWLVLHGICCVLAAAICCYVVPRGLAIMWSTIRNFFSSPNHSKRLNRQLELLSVEEDVCSLFFS
jgi:hypothetical protein